MAEHRGGSGNFAEDRQRASEAGRKGGKVSGGILRTILSAPLWQEKKVAATVAGAKVRPMTVTKQPCRPPPGSPAA
ncbi:hypothetical protein ERHA54_16210 [Erwinia rhapontici]|nr:hypothetical protein ERHA54_16210 [Erwinia rhapontici]BCQ44170.1 hypothetical protein ERHA55_16970 [Erwinia rhapontici]